MFGDGVSARCAILIPSPFPFFSYTLYLPQPLRTTPAVRALVSGISVAVTPAPTPSASSSALSTPSSLSRRSSFLPAPPAPAPSTSAPPISIYTHLAYAELLALASSDEAGAAKARAEAFDVDGAVWARLVREALVLIGREYQLLLARGAPPAPPAAAPAPSARPASSSSSPAAAGASITPSPLLKQNVFAKQGPPSPAARVGAALASGGAVDELVAPIAVPEVKIPDWRSYVPVPALPAWVRTATNAALAVSLPRAWTQPRRGRAVAGWVPRREVCVQAIGGAFSLLCLYVCTG